MLVKAANCSVAPARTESAEMMPTFRPAMQARVASFATVTVFPEPEGPMTINACPLICSGKG